MKRPKLIFDFDQTLAYRDGMWSASILEILQEANIYSISIADIRKYIKTGFPWEFYETPHEQLFNGKSWWEYMEAFMQRILMNNGLDSLIAKQLSKHLKAKYLDTNYWHLYEETLPTLKKLKKFGYECYVLSNHTPELEQLVNYLGLNSYIEKIYNSAFIGYEKPHSNIYHYVLNDLKCSPEQVIMIGDNYISDVTGGRSNGLNAILVRSENVFNYRYYAPTLDLIFPILEQIEAKLK